MKLSLIALRKLVLVSVFFALCSAASAQTITWTGIDATNGVSDNWSDTLNWLGNSLPAAGNTVVFANNDESTGQGTGFADNIVDTNFTIAALWYAATNIAPNYLYHNTVINSGVTLTVSNNAAAIVLDAGTQNDPPAAAGGAICYNTINGPGTLVVNDTNSESVMIVSQGSSTYAGTNASNSLFAILDMSALNTFHGTFGRLLVGVQGVGPTPGQVTLNPSGRQAGEVALAFTNTVYLTQVGNNPGTGIAAASGPALVMNDSPIVGDFGCTLYWGQSNALYADSITIGRIQCSRTAIFAFNPYLEGPSFYLRGFSSNRVSEFIVADNTANPNTGTAPPGAGIVPPPGNFQVGSAGLVDLSLGTADWMIDTLIIGKSYTNSGGGYSAGLFNLGAGALDVNTLSLGVLSSGSAAVPAMGTFNVGNGGSLIVNGPLALGQTFGGGTSPFAYGALNLDGGAVYAPSFNSGGNSAITTTTTGGTISLTSQAGSIGTAAAPIGNMAFGGSTTLNLAVGPSGPPVVVSNFTGSGISDTINITALPPITSTVIPASVPLIQSSTPIVNYAFVLGSLPLGFKGSLRESSDGTLVQLLVSGAPVSPTNAALISSVVYQPETGSIVITATKGVPNGEFTLLTSTSAMLPLAGWTPVVTSASTFDASGNATVTIPYSSSDISRFYVIKQ